MDAQPWSSPKGLHLSFVACIIYKEKCVPRGSNHCSGRHTHYDCHLLLWCPLWAAFGTRLQPSSCKSLTVSNPREKLGREERVVPAWSQRNQWDCHRKLSQLFCESQSICHVRSCNPSDWMDVLQLYPQKRKHIGRCLSINPNVGCYLLGFLNEISLILKIWQEILASHLL